LAALLDMDSDPAAEALAFEQLGAHLRPTAPSLSAILAEEAYRLEPTPARAVSHVVISQERGELERASNLLRDLSIQAELDETYAQSARTVRRLTEWRRIVSAVPVAGPRR